MLNTTKITSYTTFFDFYTLNKGNHVLLSSKPNTLSMIGFFSIFLSLLVINILLIVFSIRKNAEISKKSTENNKINKAPR